MENELNILLNNIINANIVDNDETVKELQRIIEMNERKKYLAMHPYKITLLKDGRYSTRLPDEKRTVVRKFTRKEVEDVVINYFKGIEETQKTENKTFEDVVNEWLLDQLQTNVIQENTYDRYKSDYKRFFSQNALVSKRFRDITELDLDNYLLGNLGIIKTLNLDNKGYQKVKSLLCGVYKYADRQIHFYNYQHIDIMRYFDNLRTQITPLLRRKIDKSDFIDKDKDQVFTKAEIDKICAYIDTCSYENNDRGKSAFMIDLGIKVLLLSGLRAGEIATLKICNVYPDYINVTNRESFYKNKDAEGNILSGCNYVINDGAKKNKYRSVIIPSICYDVLRALISMSNVEENKEGFVFFRKNYKSGKYENIHGQSFTQRLERICEKCDIDKKSAHKLRKTYASNLVENGFSPMFVKNQLGHNDFKTTEENYLRNTIVSSESVNQINGLFGTNNKASNQD